MEIPISPGGQAGPRVESGAVPDPEKDKVSEKEKAEGGESAQNIRLPDAGSPQPARDSLGSSNEDQDYIGEFLQLLPELNDGAKRWLQKNCLRESADDIIQETNIRTCIRLKFKMKTNWTVKGCFWWNLSRVTIDWARKQDALGRILEGYQEVARARSQSSDEKNLDFKDTLSRLEEEHLEIVIMVMQGRNPPEIAEIRDISRTTAYRRYDDALKRLKELLGDGQR